MFSCEGAYKVWLSNDSAMTIDTGVGLKIYNTELVWPIATYGQLVRKAWWGLAETGAQWVNVYEGFLDFERYRHLMREYAQG